MSKKNNADARTDLLMDIEDAFESFLSEDDDNNVIQDKKFKAQVIIDLLNRYIKKYK